MKKDGKPSKRDVELTIATSAGYHEDMRDYVRILCERKVTSRKAIDEAYNKGRRLKQSGQIHCTCYRCKTP